MVKDGEVKAMEGQGGESEERRGKALQGKDRERRANGGEVG